MDRKEYLERMAAREYIVGGSDAHVYMTEAAHEAQRVTAEMNCGYKTPEELRGWYTMKGFYFEKPIRDFELLKSPALADEIAGGLRRLKPLFVLMRDLVPIEDEDDAVRPMDRV